MKIAVVHSFYSDDSPSGENIAVLDQVSALEKAGHNVLLVSVYTDQLQKKPAYAARTGVNIATGRGTSPVTRLKQFQPDIVHVHNLFPNYASSWVDEWHGPVVSTVHNFRPMCSAGTLFRDGAPCTLCPDHGSIHAVVHACYRQSRIATVPLALATRKSNGLGNLLAASNRILLLSERSRNIYQSYGLDKERTTVVPNFRPDAPINKKSPVSETLPWVFLGRLTSEKGILELLKQWPRNQSLEVYGEGPLREQIEPFRSKDVNIRGRARESEVPEILRTAKGLILPSLWAEGAAPLVYLESLAAGRPVICRRGNAAADDILINGGGVVYSDAAELANAVNAAPSVLNGLGNQARSNYQKMYTEEAWVQRIESVYEELLDD